MPSATRLTLQQANTMIAGCFDKGRSLGTRPIAAVVLDPGGYLIAAQRSDGAANLLAGIAIAKASGAIGMGMSSRQLGVMAGASPNFVASVAPLSQGGLVVGAGAVLIVDDGGASLGVVAVAGDLPDNDEVCAIAGITAAGLTARG